MYFLSRGDEVPWFYGFERMYKDGPREDQIHFGMASSYK